MKRSGSCAFLLWLAALGLLAQAPAPSQALPQAVVKPKLTRRVLWIGLAGAAAGAVVGTQAVSFSALPADERSAHEFRSGLVYGATTGVLSAALAARFSPGADASEPHSFLWDPWNTPLLAGIVAVHVLDFTSTRYFRDRGKDEWLLTDQLVDNRPAFVATEAEACAAGIGLIYLLHRSGHHRLERWAAAGYITIGTVSAVGNYRYPATGHDIF
jgi:hypothetical protein